MIITEKDSSFKDYYLKCVEIPHFKTALLGKEIPNIGSILIKDKQIISLCAAYKVAELNNISWWTSTWACMRKNSNLLMDTTKKTINRFPNNSRILSYILTRDEKNSLTYRASLLLAKRLGFKIIESNLTCDIIEYRL